MFFNEYNTFRLSPSWCLSVASALPELSARRAEDKGRSRRKARRKGKAGFSSRLPEPSEMKQ